jgi:subtilisin family serine protease
VSHTLCSSASRTADAEVALVDRGGSRPAVVTFHATTAADVSREVDQLQTTGHVLAVGPDQPVHAQAVNPTQNPDYSGFQTDLQATQDDFPAAWAAGLDGSGVRVAVVDTGVQANHPDLAGNVTAGEDFVVGNQPSNYARIDGYGHGTHVAGTIAAVDNTIGVVGGAPHATIVPVRVLDCQGAGYTSTVASGIEWASDPVNGGAARVINLSLGGCGDDPVLRQAVLDAISRGVVVVAAAGNGFNGAGGCAFANEPEYPGAYAGQPGFAGTIAVGALDGSTGHRAGFSNNNPYVTVAAPGVSILSTVPFGGTAISNASGYGLLSGTSMATPHVSAVAALVLQRCPADTAAQVATRITSGAAALAMPADFQSGTVGLLRADAVVSGVCP